MSTTRTTSYARAPDGGYVGYQTMGTGDVDLLIGSYGSISIDSFDEQPQLAHFLDSLATFARLVLFDWRGVGLSDPLPADSEPDLPSAPPTWSPCSMRWARRRRSWRGSTAGRQRSGSRHSIPDGCARWSS